MRSAFPRGGPFWGCASRVVAVHGSSLKFTLQTSVASTRQGSNRDTLDGEARAKRSWLPIPPAAGRVGDARFSSFRAVDSAPTAWGPQNPAPNLSRQAMPRCTMMHQIALGSPGVSDVLIN